MVKEGSLACACLWRATHPSPFGLDSLLPGSSGPPPPPPAPLPPPLPGTSLAMPLLFMPFMVALFRLGFYKK